MKDQLVKAQPTLVAIAAIGVVLLVYKAFTK